MFGNKSKQTIEVTKLSSLIAHNLQVVGDITFTGGLRIDGRVDGNVISKRGDKSLVVISEKGCVIGRVCAYDAVVNGTISGDLEVEHFLELQPDAKVSGNITYRRLQMECGATVEGRLLKVHEADTERAKRLAVAPATEAKPRLERAAEMTPEIVRDMPSVIRERRGDKLTVTGG